MEYLQTLKALSLSPQAARTYIALLKEDVSSIRKIAEITGINRGTTYEALRELVEIGLVSIRKRGERNYYAPESPEKMHDIATAQKKLVQETANKIEEIVPELLAMKKRPQGEPTVKYYEYDDGIVALLKDVLETTKSLPKREYCIYSTKELREYLYRKFPDFTKKRLTNKIFVKVIAIGQGGDKVINAERKWLEAKESSGGSYTIIYGNKVAVISISRDYTPYAVVIEEEAVANTQRLIFNTIWQSLS